ncbi:hypothetical protein [Kitasatospora aureofaciens]|uniref:hypothetical protein n=1 Tax=Kitasatospora aureofaciens TaxID=1894 RepID=UPI001DFDFA0F|nr:hypothetical protein [Kitasatospora aureofaciens]HJD85711.1 hypothetical protein [Kitasatospora aureofaciens]
MSKSLIETMMERLACIKWTNLEGRNAHATSRAWLMIEYLRRAALWAEMSGGAPRWPYFDIAGTLAPDVQMDPEVTERLEEYIEDHVEGVSAEFVCRAAVRWATLQDTPGVQLPDLPDPFEPLILMYERGGEVIMDDSRAFNFADLRVQVNLWSDHLSPEPATALDPDTLDALDREGRASFHRGSQAAAG